MQSYQRHQRVESLIQAELNKIILRELEFDGALVTITAVEVQKDLDYALIKFSVLPNGKKEAVLELFQKTQRRLKHLLADQIEIKPMPELRFEIDEGPEKAAAVEKVFIEIEKEEKNG